MSASNPVETAIRGAVTSQRSELLALIRRRGGSAAEAEDVLQIAIERALSRGEQLRDPSRAEAWVGRIVRNALIDELRKRRTHDVSLDERVHGESADDTFDCDCVLAQIGELKPAYADLLRRVVIEGQAVSYVAGELGLTPNNAMVRLHRARKALRAQLEAHCGTTSAGACADCGCRERRCCATS